MRTPPEPAREGRRGQTGSAVVEFALVLPLVLIVALALVQTGLLVRDRLLVESAARAGARAAALADDPGSIRGAALAGGAGLDPAHVSVAVTRAGGQGDPVTVGIAYDVAIRVPGVSWLFPSGVRLEAEATARQEYG